MGKHDSFTYIYTEEDKTALKENQKKDKSSDRVYGKVIPGPGLMVIKPGIIEVNVGNGLRINPTNNTLESDTINMISFRGSNILLTEDSQGRLVINVKGESTLDPESDKVPTSKAIAEYTKRKSEDFLKESGYSGVTEEEKNKWVISYNSNTKKMYLEVTGNSFYFLGGEKIEVSNKTFIWEPHNNETGKYYFSITKEGGLAITDKFSNSGEIQVVSLYYTKNNYGTPSNIVNYLLSSPTMSSSTKKYLKERDGARLITNTGIYSYSLNAPIQNWKLEEGRISYTDITINTPALNGTSYLLGYFNPISGFQWKTSNEPYFSSNGILQYNGEISLALAQEDRPYVNYYVVSTSALEENKRVILIPGRNSYRTLKEAQAETPSDLNMEEFPFEEFAFSHQITYKRDYLGTVIADHPAILFTKEEYIIPDLVKTVLETKKNTADIAKYSSIEKITGDLLTENGLLDFMETLEEGIYTLETYRNGTELFFKGTVTETDYETDLEVKRLKYSRVLSNGTSWEWSEGLGEWTMAAGGGGGGGTGGGPTGNLRLYAYPLGSPTSFTVAMGSEVKINLQYLNALVSSGTLTTYKNGQVITVETVSTGIITKDLSLFIQVGSNKFDFSVKDMFGNETVVTFLINAVIVSVSSTFDEFKAYQESGSIVFSVNASGTRTAIITLDGESEEFPADTIVNEYAWSGLEHGVHPLTIQARSVYPDGLILLSNTIKYNLVIVEEGNNTSIISTKFDKETVMEGTVINLEYFAYKQDSELIPVTLKINDETVSSVNVDRKKQVWKIGNLALGTYTLRIETSGVFWEHEIEVVELDVKFEMVRDSFLDLSLDAIGKSNQAIDKDVWISNEGVQTTTYFQDFNWSTNGWVDDALVFNGMAKAIVSYKPFATEITTGQGMTLEIDVEVENDLGSGVPFIECMNNNRGFQILSDRVILKASDASTVTLFEDRRRLKLSFVVDAHNRAIYTYIDGVMSGIDRLSAFSSFLQSSPQNILINQSLLGGKVYSIRVYKRPLSHHEILQNYLFTMSNIDEKIQEYIFSDIYTESLDMDFLKLKEKIPTVTVRIYEKDENGNSLPATADYRPVCDVIIEHNTDSSKNFTAYNATIRTQGTSTLAYPVKNYRITLPSSTEYSLDPTETRPTRILNLKADYMESSLSTNVGLCRLINGMYNEKMPVQEVDELARNTTYGYPVAFLLDDGTGALKFWGIYNLNTDKSDPQMFGFYEDNGFPEARRFENVRNVGNSSGAFIRKPGLSDQNWFTECKSDWEAIYPTKDTSLENYEPLMEVIDFVSDYVNQTPSTISAYSSEFRKRINVEYAIKYLLTCYIVGAVDSFGKDLLLNTFGEESEGFYKWYFTFYDLDTCLGIDNTGRMLDETKTILRYDYDIELEDQNAFAQAQSRLWDVVQELFPAEIEQTYAEMRTSSFTFNNIWKHLNEYQVSKISKSMYNANAVTKYIEALGSEDWLWMLHGDRVNQIRRWITRRLGFLDSKYGFNKDAYKIDFRLDTEDASQIKLTLTPSTHLWVNIMIGNQADAQSYGRTRAKAGEAVEVGPSYTGTTALQYVEGSIFNADKIVDLGDIGSNEDFVLRNIRISSAINLKEVKLGKSSPSAALMDFVIGENPELEYLDLRNNTSLQGPLDLSGCVKLRYLDLRGTNYTSVEFPRGGVLQECYLPNTVRIISLTNQAYLTKETFVLEEGAEIDYLRVENSPGIDFIDMIPYLTEEANVRIMGVNLSLYDNIMLEVLRESLDGRGGIDVEGKLTERFAFYGNAKVLNVSEFDPEFYETFFPNINFTFMNWNNDFVIDGRGAYSGYTLAEYKGDNTLITIPKTEWNDALTAEDNYFASSIEGWGPITTIAPGVFGSGIRSIVLDSQIEYIADGAFTNEFTGCITTELLTKPEDWNIGDTTIYTFHPPLYEKDNYLMGVSTAGVLLFRYLGSNKSIIIPESIVINQANYNVNILDKTLLLEDEDVEELFIPYYVTTIGEGLTDSMVPDGMVWSSRSSEGPNWNANWNRAEIETVFNTPKTKVEFNIYSDGLLNKTIVSYGITERMRKAEVFGSGLYTTTNPDVEVSYPLTLHDEENILNTGLIQEWMEYEFDDTTGTGYKAIGWDRARTDEGVVTVQLRVKAKYDDGVNGELPVESTVALSIGDGGEEDLSVKEIIFDENDSFRGDGLADYCFAGFSNVDTFVLPDNITHYPVECFKDCLFIDTFNFLDVEEIGDYAFRGCSLTNLFLPESLTEIGEGAFQENNISKIWIYGENIVLGDNLLTTEEGFENNFREAYSVDEDGIYFGTQNGAWAQDQELPTLSDYFTVVDGMITAYDVAGGLDVVLPFGKDDEDIIGVAEGAMKGLGLTSIYIPRGYEIIEAEAFADNELTSIKIPNSVTYIGPKALRGLKESDIELGSGVTEYLIYENDGEVLAGHIATYDYTSFTIPETIKVIKSRALENSAIERMNISSRNTLLEIEEEAFYGSTSLFSIKVFVTKDLLYIDEDIIAEGDNSLRDAITNEKLYNGKGIYKIINGTWAWFKIVWEYEWSFSDFSFETKSNVTVEFPDGDVTYDEVYVLNSFEELAKTGYNVPGDVDDVQVIMLSEATQPVAGALEEIRFHPDILVAREVEDDIVIPYEGMSMHATFAGFNTLATIHAYPNIVVDFSEAFKGTNHVIPFAIPETVTNMHGTFEDCINLETVSAFPEGAYDLSNTFKGCVALEEVSGIPEGVVNMKSAFEGCTNLTDVELPSTVEDLSFTFKNCTTLEEVNEIPVSAINMVSTFEGCVGLTDCGDIPAEVTNLSNAFANSGIINMPNILTEVEVDMFRTFYNCKNMEEVSALPEGVTNLEETFFNCTNIWEAPEVPNGVTGLVNTFYGCVDITDSPKIPNSVTNMVNTFYGCESLESIDGISDNTENMYKTFYGCESLTDAPSMPNTITNMVSTFQNCKGLINVASLPNSVMSLPSTFYGCENLLTVTAIPEKIISLVNTFYGCSNLVDAPTIHSNVTNMTSTFQECYSLENVSVLPTKITALHNTFKNCSNLVDIPEIPVNVTILDGTFSGCTGIAEIPEIKEHILSMPSAFKGTSIVNAPLIPDSVVNISGAFSDCSSLVNAPQLIGMGITDMSNSFSNTPNLIGNVVLISNMVAVSGGMNNAFTSPTFEDKSFYIPYTGLNTTHNSMAAADYSLIDGNYGVVIKNTEDLEENEAYFAIDDNGYVVYFSMAGKDRN